jgi:hypothetical protein
MKEGAHRRMRCSSKEVSSASSTAPNSRFSSTSLASSIRVRTPEPSVLRVGVVSFQPGTSGGPTITEPAAGVDEGLDVLLREKEEMRARVAAAAECEELGFHGLAEAEAAGSAWSAVFLVLDVVVVDGFDLGRVVPADAGLGALIGRIMPYGVYAAQRPAPAPLQSAKTLKL